MVPKIPFRYHQRKSVDVISTVPSIDKTPLWKQTLSITTKTKRKTAAIKERFNYLEQFILSKYL